MSRILFSHKHRFAYACAMWGDKRETLLTTVYRPLTTKIKWSDTSINSATKNEQDSVFTQAPLRLCLRDWGSVSLVCRSEI